MDFSIFEKQIKNEIKPRFLVDGLLTIIKDHNLIRSERLPNKGETVAIVSSYPKVAALLYDKIFCVYGDAPEEISVNINSKSYFRQLLADICSYTLELDRYQQESKIDDKFRKFASKALSDDDPLLDKIGNESLSEYIMAHVVGFKFNVIHQYSDLSVLMKEREETGNDKQFVKKIHSLFDKFVLRWHSDNLLAEYNIQSTPVYSTIHDREIVYSPGDFSAVCMSLINLEIVNEKDLEWNQVIDFRKDAEALLKYRKFINWLNKDMIGKSQGFIENEIAVRLDDYMWAIKKHGIKTTLGVISNVFNSKFLFGSAATSSAVAWMSEPIAGLFAMGGLLVGKVAIQIAQTCLEIKEIARNMNPEISYVHDIGKIKHKV